MVQPNDGLPYAAAYLGREHEKTSRLAIISVYIQFCESGLTSLDIKGFARLMFYYNITVATKLSLEHTSRTKGDWGEIQFYDSSCLVH